MVVQPEHIQWLVDTEQRLQTSDGRSVEVWEFRHQPDDRILSAWAKHFRNHYCLDCQIDQLRQGTGLSRRDYLINLKFPDPGIAPGPSIRSGDFGEILVADFLEFRLGFWVPRTRYSNKAVRNESTKGCDIIGIRFFREGTVSPQDVLAVFEAKAQLSGLMANSRLQDAVDGSCKDLTRKADTLNAMKQRFLDAREDDAAFRVERFQDPEDRPYREISGAAVIFATPLYSPSTIRTVDTSRHPNQDNLHLIVFCGDNLMDLVHELYRRAADEA
jgi:hypothetical protein